MAKTKSSKRWLKEHFADKYVLKAQKDGYRSRAIYKLFEINEKDKLFAKGMTVVDLGAAPGGWSQAAKELVGDKGKVIALDILPIEPIPEVLIIQGDFRSELVLEKLLKNIANSPIDLVISDMAPNMSGNAAIDIPRSMYLVELALDFVSLALKPGGHFVTKIFQGEGFDAFLKTLKQSFKQVYVRKPVASRGRSKECYLVAKEYKV